MLMQVGVFKTVFPGILTFFTIGKLIDIPQIRENAA